MRTLDPFDHPASSLSSVHRWALPMLALAVAGAFGLAACGGSSSEPTGPDDEADATTDDDAAAITVRVAQEVSRTGVTVAMGDVAVRLFRDDEDTVATATTATDGVTSFRDLESGTYSVEVKPSGPDTAAGNGSLQKTATVESGSSADLSFLLVYTVSDIDGNLYRTTRIGEQRWTTENLRVGRYGNGDSIPNQQSTDAWQTARESGTGAWAHFDNDPSHAETYGRLYNQYAAIDARGVCPEGWHVPTGQEWQTLESQAGVPEGSLSHRGWRGGEEEAGGNLKSTRSGGQSHPRWDMPNAGATNQTGFSALPHGFRVGVPLSATQTEGEFLDLGNEGPLWTSTEDPEGPTAGGENRYWAASLKYDEAGIYRNSADGFGFGIRCTEN